MDLPYRQGVQAYIFNDKNEILVVCNANDANFWKMPSGGIDIGETSEETLHREVMEELGIKVRIIKKSKHKNKFDWPKEIKIKTGNKYRGQEQEVFITKIERNQNIKPDFYEISDYKWVYFKDVNKILKLEHQQITTKKIIQEYRDLTNIS